MKFLEKALLLSASFLLLGFALLSCASLTAKSSPTAPVILEFNAPSSVRVGQPYTYSFKIQSTIPIKEVEMWVFSGLTKQVVYTKTRKPEEYKITKNADGTETYEKTVEASFYKGKFSLNYLVIHNVILYCA